MAPWRPTGRASLLRYGYAPFMYLGINALAIRLAEAGAGAATTLGLITCAVGVSFAAERVLPYEIARSAVDHLASTPDGARSAAAAWRSWAGALAERVIGDSPGPPLLSPVIRRILGLLHDPADARPSLAALAAAAGLSPSRLMHLFRQQVGLPLRAYVRWRRLARAANKLAAGATLPEAAHVAGCADSAHLSRTFRTTFGGAPSDVFRAARLVRAVEERGRVSPPPSRS